MAEQQQQQMPDEQAVPGVEQTPVTAPCESAESSSVEGSADPADEAPEADQVPVGREQKVAELTADLQRLSAEYTNDRKRVERDRETLTGDAKAHLTSQLLPTLDDLHRAEAPGDLTSGVTAIVDKLQETLRSSGLQQFGTEGDPFDPEIHEAAQHQHSDSAHITEPTVTAVLRPGYRFDGRMLRTALVAVTEPEPENAAADEAQQDRREEQTG